MTAWLAETFVGTTLLMLVVLAFRTPVARAFGARWAYALWLLPGLRLFLPPLSELFPQAPLPPVVIFIPTTAELAAPPPAEMAASGEWMPFLVALWAGGAVIFLTLQWLGYREFLHRLDATARPARPPSYGGIAILVSPDVEGPVALGLFRRRIVVPADFLRRYSPDEQRLAMEHELIHHRRGDMWWNLGALVMLALNWFNPVAWFAFRAFRNDQELACDAAVAARASQCERHDYASALVKSATRPGLIAACPLTRAGQLKHRLRMMGSHRISRLRSFGGGSAVSALAVGAMVLTPTFSRAPESASPPMAAPVPAARTAAVSQVRSVAAAVTPPTPAKHARPATRHAPKRSAPADPLALAAATPVALPDVKLPALAPSALTDWSRSGASARSRRVVRVASPTRIASVQVFSAAFVPAAESETREKLDFVAGLLARMAEQDPSDPDLKALKSALERAHGHLKIKVLKETGWEDGA